MWNICTEHGGGVQTAVTCELTEGAPYVVAWCCTFAALKVRVYWRRVWGVVTCVKENNNKALEH